MGLFDRILKGPDEARAAKGTPGSPPVTAASRESKERYDEVSAPGPDGEPQRMSKQQFERLPLENRVRLLVQGTLRFYRGGEEIPPSEAMRSAY
jgi:hypothetical protein